MINADTDRYSIIPISDNGGSSSELIRVFGGPGIGDIRSRYSRLWLFTIILDFIWTCSLNVALSCSLSLETSVRFGT